jgi:predicted signal transduction protein with EAL and GGDEF domain
MNFGRRLWLGASASVVLIGSIGLIIAVNTLVPAPGQTPRPVGHVSAQPSPIIPEVGGIVFCLLLGAMIYVLGTSRSRAVELVAERTHELRHQALHDPLTGLPNRALILDRIEHMQARARRQHTPIATLFIDLDDFKDINDTLGHGAGDEEL